MTAPLTTSGEVAVFVDDNQFGAGQSVDKCGPESVALFWHSVAPGQANPYTAADIHTMAHDDYVKFIGPDAPSDTGGTTVQTLEAMLSEHNFKFENGQANIAWAKEQLNQGLPVFLLIAESSVVDNGLGTGPYNWNTTNLLHIVLASGPGAGGEILVRDTANIAPTGVRPGPRHYDANKLQIIAAVSATPSWISNPPPAPPNTMMEQAEDYWNSTDTGAPFTTGIAQSWQAEYKAYRLWGPPLGKEFATVDWSGNAIVAQMFPLGRCEWRNGNPAWYKWG